MSLTQALWRLSYTIIPYIREKFERIGLSFQSLFNMPRGMEVPFLTYQQFSNLIGSVVPIIVKEQNWQPMMDAIWANRDEADYEVSGIHRRTAGNFSVIAVFIRQLKVLPGTLGIAVPYQLRKYICVQKFTEIIAADHIKWATRQVHVS